MCAVFSNWHCKPHHVETLAAGPNYNSQMLMYSLQVRSWNADLGLVLTYLDWWYNFEMALIIWYLSLRF